MQNQDFKDNASKLAWLFFKKTGSVEIYNTFFELEHGNEKNVECPKTVYKEEEAFEF